jgi:hypothetical protein
MDDLLISPATVLWDIPVKFPITGTKPYSPRNYDGKFHGPVTVRTALANSYNVPAVKLLEAVTVDRMLRGAEVMGIRSLSDSGRTFGLALTLGGGDVTLLAARWHSGSKGSGSCAGLAVSEGSASILPVLLECVGSRRLGQGDGGVWSVCAELHGGGVE